MKEIKNFINENSKISNVNKAISLINNAINYGEEVDEVIFDLLDGISDKGEDDLVVDNISGWLDQITKK